MNRPYHAGPYAVAEETNKAQTSEVSKTSEVYLVGVDD